MAEEVFLKYLRKVYARNKGVAVTIRREKGGTADGVVTSAIKFLGDFDQKVVVLDNDKPKQEIENARKKAQESGIILIENKPCLEATLLSALNDSQDFSNQKSAWCKKEFENKFISKKKRSDLVEYEKIFSKKLLDNQSRSIVQLEKIILLMKRLNE